METYTFITTVSHPYPPPV